MLKSFKARFLYWLQVKFTSSRNNILAATRTGTAVFAVFLLKKIGELVGIEFPADVAFVVGAFFFSVAVSVYNFIVNWLAVHVHPVFGYLLGAPHVAAYPVKSSGGSL